MSMNKQIPYIDLLSKKLASEGMVLLKKGFLPLKGKINLFGRGQFNYYKSGTGSGGLVNTPYVYSLYDVLSNSPIIELNESLARVYKDFIKENPFNYGNGTWASEPWSQKEMLIDEMLVSETKKFSDIAVIIIARTAGEDKDFSNERGSYKLSTEELDLIKKVRKHFNKVLLILNVGTIIDINEIIDDVDAILLSYHGGFYGAVAIYEAITGLTSPTGSLPFTILKDLKKDITYETFKAPKTVYTEDIYVGYRYHHTFLESNILYPLGYSENYSNFKLKDFQVNINKELIEVTFKIKNIGLFKSNKTIFFYLEQPHKYISKPKYVIAHFYKSQLLNPNETLEVKTSFNLYNIATYDDDGIIVKNGILLEKGLYKLNIGFHLGDILYSHSFSYDDHIHFGSFKPIPLEKPFLRLKNIENKKVYELTPFEGVPSYEVKDVKLKESTLTFNDVKTLEDLKEFTNSLTNEELCHLIKGEGMSSPKVTPGIAGAIGGLTNSLKEKGIPIIGCADGPSGIRMDSGFYASSLPNATLIASSYNLSLIEELYKLVGYEMDNYNIDILLGPGMNLQRNHLCGRNFEYFSEDPLITGYIGASVIKGLHKAGKYGSLKHYALNNQETNRFSNEVWVSNRAFREIYHRSFEYIIKNADAQVIMSSYNYINGYHSASHPTLYHTLKLEGFKGIIISDWWAHLNDVETPLDRTLLSKMVLANHDLYMVVKDTTKYKSDLEVSLKNKVINRGHLVTLASNILKFIYNIKPVDKKIPSLNIKVNGKTHNKGIIEENVNENLSLEYNYIYNKNAAVILTEIPIHIIPPLIQEKAITATNNLIVNNINSNPSIPTIIDKNIDGKKDVIKHYKLNIKVPGKYIFNFLLENDSSVLSQTSFNLYFNEKYAQTFTYNKFDGILSANAYKVLKKGEVIFSIKFNQSGLKVNELKISLHP